jgi:hypothetical protein
MRPKVVIITLLLGVGVLILIASIHGIMSRQDGQPLPPVSSGAPAELTNTKPVKVARSQDNPAETNIVAVTPDEERAAQKQKDLEAISDALISGAGDPRSVFEIANRLENPDAEVRKAALEATMHLGDTNVMPYLNVALENIQDPREKVGIMDAIAYLQLPTTPAIPSNGMAPPTPNPMPMDRGSRTNTVGRTKRVSVTPGQPPTAQGAQ